MKKYFREFGDACIELAVTTLEWLAFGLEVTKALHDAAKEGVKTASEEAFDAFWAKMWELDKPKKHLTYLEILLGTEEIKKSAGEVLFGSRNELVEWKEEWNPKPPQTLQDRHPYLPTTPKIDGEQFMQTGKNNKDLKVFIYNPAVLAKVQLKD